MKEETIRSVIDAMLQKCIDHQLNRLPIRIEPEMAVHGQNDNEEWNFWVPVPSTVTGQDILELEETLGHKLPLDYITFLKHKHFYDLFISQVNFCSHPIHTWMDCITELIYESWSQEHLIARGYIPFATFSDWGLLCFDTSKDPGDHNYPVVFWSHDEWYEVMEQDADFYNCLLRLVKEEEEMHA